MHRERASLEEELAATRLPQPEARDRLLSRVRNDSARLVQVEARISELDAETESRRRAAVDTIAELEGRRASDSGKYEVR